MPFTLTTEQRLYRAEVVDRMQTARLRITACNAEATALAADIAATAQAEIDNRPARWRLSRAGLRAQAWTTRWRDFHPTPDDVHAAEAFSALPDDAE